MKKTTCLLLFSLLLINISYAQNVGISNAIFTPRSYLHVHQPNASGNLLQLTNSSSGNTADNLGMVFSVSTNDWTLRNYQAGAFTLQTGNSYMNFLTNNTERMRIGADGSVGIGTSTFEANYLVSILAHQTNTKRSGIYLTMSAQSSTSYGMYISASNGDSRGILYENSTTASSSLFGLGAVLTSTNIVSGYSAYRTGTGRSYGVYGITGTTGAYTSANNQTWAGFLQGRTVITGDSPLDPDQIADLEVRNTKSGSANPPLISLRHNSQQSANTNILGEIHFGDSYTVNPQANIQVVRDNAAGAGDYPTAMTFWTTTDGTPTLSERMRITSDGRVGIRTTPNEITHQLTISGTNNSIRLIGSGASSEGATILFGETPGGTEYQHYITQDINDGLRFHAPGRKIFTGYASGTSNPYVGITDGNVVFNPWAVLHIYSSTANLLMLGPSTASNRNLLFSQSGANFTINNRETNGSLIFQTPGTGSIRFNTSGTNERVRITSTGAVGIGTTAPATQFHTTGSVRFAGAGTPGAGKVLTSDASGNATWENNKLPDGTASGDMLYWNGSAWVRIPVGTDGQVLKLVSGVPTWVDYS